MPNDDQKKPAPAAEDKHQPDSKLVKVKKGDDTIHVDPAVVHAHEEAGWVRA